MFEYFNPIHNITLEENHLVLFPNQLFETKWLPTSVQRITLVEHPIFFGFREKKYKFNKLKLVLHRASMKAYAAYLKEKNYKVTYLDMHEAIKGLHKLSAYVVIEVNDRLLEKQIHPKQVLPTPNFLLSMQDLQDYFDQNKKNAFQHKKFFDHVKKKFQILESEKSHDMENRQKIPPGTIIPPLPTIPKNTFVEEAKKYVEKYFPKNYGNVDNFFYPVTFVETKQWFKTFLKERMPHFGQYEDAIYTKSNFLFHSVTGPLMNIGLIQPSEVALLLQKQDIAMNNYEGYIRQILGWREYQRFCYRYAYDQMKDSNIFGNQKKLDARWYDGTLGVEPVDRAIQDAFHYGYLHHILRLMVMCNFMNLNEIHPHEVYKWFMEFSVDSYDWVMIQNVYSMGMWADGGLTMRKPYISSDNYIRQMSNYKKGEWCITWNTLYYQFLANHADILRKTLYGRNLAAWDRKSSVEKKRILNFQL